MTDAGPYWGKSNLPPSYREPHYVLMDKDQLDAAARKLGDEWRAEKASLIHERDELRAEVERLTVELTHRVRWEQRCLDAEAALERYGREIRQLRAHLESKAW